jgi:mannose-6-phosphate isomerase
VTSGDAIFIPSGRLHAIGAGLMIFEIQQNSDTTYRVFDWNRIGLDGTPRPLHVQESLACIDFSDCHPALTPPDAPVLASCRHFRVRRIVQPAQSTTPWGMPGDFSILAVVRGSATIAGESLKPGDFAIVPASLPASLRTVQTGHEETEFLETSFGQSAD